MASINEANGKFKTNRGFTIIDNAAARDRTLSEKALGLYVRIASYITIPDIEITKAKIITWCSCKEKAFESAWKELKNRGYLLQTLQSTGTSWIVEYELLMEPRKDGIHTIYLNGKGEMTANNLTRKERREQDQKHIDSQVEVKDRYPQNGSNGKEDDIHTPQKGGNGKTMVHTPHFGSNGNGSTGKGGNKVSNIYKTKNNNISNQYHYHNQYQEVIDRLKEHISYDLFDEQDKILLNDILDIIATEVFLTDKKKINLGSSKQLDEKSVDIVRNVIDKKMDMITMRCYIKQIRLYARRITSPTKYHVKGVYKQCLEGRTKCISAQESLP